MRTHHLLISAGACALALATVFIPGEEERSAMLARDGHTALALEVLEKMYKSGKREPQVLMQLYDYRERLGRTEDAAGVLTEYVTAFPKERLAYELLATLFLNTHQTSKAIAVYEQKLDAVRPFDTHDIKTLLGLYRKYGLYARELELLKKSNDDALEAEDFFRLGTMLASARDLKGAIEALVKADQKMPLRERGSPQEKEARLALFGLLLEAGQPERAAAMAVKWCEVWKSRFLFQSFARRFVQEAPAAITEFAHLAEQRMPNADFEIAEVLSTWGRPDLAAKLLIELAPRLKGAHPKTIRRFIELANQSVDPTLPMRVLDKFIDEGVAPNAIASLANQIAKQNGMIALSSLRFPLSHTVLTAKPLFGARYSYAMGNLMLARDFVLNVNPQTLEEPEISDWVELLTVLTGRQEAFNYLTALYKHETPPPVIYAALMETFQRDQNSGIARSRNSAARETQP